MANTLGSQQVMLKGHLIKMKISKSIMEEERERDMRKRGWGGERDKDAVLNPCFPTLAMKCDETQWNIKFHYLLLLPPTLFLLELPPLLLSVILQVGYLFSSILHFTRPSPGDPSSDLYCQYNPSVDSHSSMDDSYGMASIIVMASIVIWLTSYYFFLK